MIWWRRNCRAWARASRVAFCSSPRAFQRQMDMGVTMIGRKIHVANGHAADAGVGQLVADQLLEFFAEAFRKTFIAVGIQTS